MSKRNSSYNARRAYRQGDRKRKRSVGATAISAPGANAIGLSRRNASRPHGRGETVRRVEASRAEAYESRPAVYTEKPQRRGILSRIALPAFRAPTLSVPRISADELPFVPVWVIAIVILAIVVAVVSGPARTYYTAWREAGVLNAEYEATAAQHSELDHEIERLQTLEGIEDEARRRGYVYPNEEALVVEGMEEEQVADPALVDAAVEEYEKNLPWYVGIFDVIFGYQHE